MKKLILMGIPHHGNLGDNAIAIAEEEILNKYFPEMEIIQFPEKGLVEEVKRNQDNINSEDIILMHGGGNIGDTYAVPEEGRRTIIKMFPKNKIIVFPQTAYFDSEEELQKSKDIYNNHSNLIIMAREEKSYEFMKKHFYNCKIFLTPDIVMTMKKSFLYERKEILFLLRTDKEQTLSLENQNKIKEMIVKEYGSYIMSDMHLGEDVTNMYDEVRENALNKKFEELNRAKLVITDRLHGMIFAAITETPCVVFGSYTHKILESYKWLKNLNFIEFCEDTAVLKQKIEKVMSCKDRHYDNSFAEDIISKILLDEI